MRRYRSYIVAAVVLYLAFLVAGAPAAWLATTLTRATRGALTFADARGTLWHGSAKIAVNANRAVAADLGRVAWRVNPLALLLLQLRVDLSATGPVKARGVLVVTPSSYSVRDLDAYAAADVIPRLAPQLGWLGPSGTLRIQGKEVSFKRGDVRGGADVEWTQAAVATVPVNPLGDYRMNLAGAGRALTFDVATLRGTLQVAGKGGWDFGSGRVRFRGQASAAGNTSALTPMLNLLGPDRGGGRHDISIDVTLSELRG